jgi:hypothetical protein
MKVQVDGPDDVFDTHTGNPTGPEHCMEPADRATPVAL